VRFQLPAVMNNPACRTNGAGTYPPPYLEQLPKSSPRSSGAGAWAAAAGSCPGRATRRPSCRSGSGRGPAAPLPSPRPSLHACNSHASSPVRGQAARHLCRCSTPGPGLPTCCPRTIVPNSRCVVLGPWTATGQSGLRSGPSRSGVLRQSLVQHAVASPAIGSRCWDHRTWVSSRTR
jgi:hypothetical protein